MQSLYNKLIVSNQQFDIYHLHYKKKFRITKFDMESYNLHKEDNNEAGKMGKAIRLEKEELPVLGHHLFAHYL